MKTKNLIQFYYENEKFIYIYIYIYIYVYCIYAL